METICIVLFYTNLALKALFTTIYIFTHTLINNFIKCLKGFSFLVNTDGFIGETGGSVVTLEKLGIKPPTFQ